MENYNWQESLRALPLLNNLLFRGGDSDTGNLNLNLTQRKTLLLLNDRSPVTQAEILPYTDRDKGALSKVIQSLVEEGFVKREHSSEDRRKVVLYLTESGKEISLLLTKNLFAHFMQVFSVLDETELTEFYKSLETLNQLSQLIGERLTQKGKELK